MDELRDAWEREGYVVLRGAAPADAVTAYGSELAAAGEGLLVRAPGDEHVSLATQLPRDGGAGVIDPYALAPAARALLLAPGVIEVLAAVAFAGDAPLLFDAAETAAGAPDPGPYRDATFTALAADPETLSTAAVALGAAEVTVFPGSHRIATTPFSGRYRHVNVERDGDAALERHRAELAAGLGDDALADTITLDPGDVLLWRADLVHRPVTGTALVGHLCPSRVQPSWFAYRPERARCAAHADRAAWLASQHYDLVDAVEPGDAPGGRAAQDEPELERVQDALREHDAELAQEPGPGPAPPPAAPPDAPAQSGRSGGLVDSVRGLMGRRGRGR